MSNERICKQIYFNRDGNIVYDPEAGIWLCPICHAEAHDNRQAFLDRIISAGVRTQEWHNELICKKIGSWTGRVRRSVSFEKAD